MDRIMLRFRPIAPKPVGGGGGSDSKNVLVNNKRCKRKYVRVSKNNSGYRRKKKTTLTQVDGTGSEDGTDNKMVTLQLLPERADSISEDPIPTSRKHHHRLGVTTSSDQTVAIETLVTVESVSTADTTTCNNNMDFRGIGSSGRLEIMMKLERDTCPAFISDGLNRVQWVNGAYKRMVMVRLLEKHQQSSAAERAVTVLVSLVMKDNYKLLKLPSSFTCKVRVEYRWQKEKEYSKMLVVPCDVWRIMELVGGFAWRLDVQAALSLGR
ncbi:hypothetical protein LWI29_013146 [Acer saccharum]|uniref:DUF7950 domain-containing protein n=1 Tax=Acer saccharum TaxID=4024 RepID=A0AA39SG33_ACESA|nr:hypothetical protein LWI29_013146 [Acer saccharum]